MPSRASARRLIAPCVLLLCGCGRVGYDDLGAKGFLRPCAIRVAQDEAYACAPSGPATAFAPGEGMSCAWLAVDPASGALGGTPDDDDVGTCMVVVTRDPGLRGEDTDRFALEVTNVAPVLTVPPSVGLAATGADLELLSDAQVASSEEGLGVYSVAASASGDCASLGPLAVDPRTGAVRFMPPAGAFAACRVTLRFDDGNGRPESVASAAVEVALQPDVRFVAESSVAREGVAYHLIPLEVPPGLASDVTLTVTRTGTAGEEDYALASGSLRLRAGRPWAALQLTIADDALLEGAETLVLELGAARHTVRIDDNDGPPLGSITRIEAGPLSYCAQAATGQFLCWGDNASGQLGDGTTQTRLGPTEATALGRDATGLSLGHAHGCGLWPTGVRCWGDNTEGQLGDGTTTRRLALVGVAGIDLGDTAFSRVSAGALHTCAVVSGRVYCWGRNAEGQLGDGTTTRRTTATRVPGLAGAIDVDAGDRHTCAVLGDGSVRCWGLNSRGQCGDGGTTNVLAPATPTGLEAGAGARQVRLGYDSSCVLLEDGSVRCWGWGTNGQLGTGTTASAPAPAPVMGLTGARQLAVSGRDWNGGGACAITGAGALRCWGTNTDGEVGDGTSEDRWAPADVAGVGRDVVAVARSLVGACAVLAAGGVRCWGSNRSASLGANAEPTLATYPLQLEHAGPGTTSRVAVGQYMGFFGRTAGTVDAAGDATYGQLGGGDRASRATVAPVQGVLAFDDLQAGSDHGCVLRGGALACWGKNANGQLGTSDPGDALQATAVPLADAVSLLAVGDFSTCAALASGEVQCWGWGWYGNLGDGRDRTSSRTPVTVSGVSSPSALFHGYAHVCAVVSGAPWCWGWNSAGQLGDGATTSRPTPVAVSGLAGAVVAGDAGYTHTCALLDDARVQCWGSNDFGELGDGTTARRLSPVTVEGLTGTVRVIAGSRHTCALDGAGALRCWGLNGLGALGDATRLNRSAPVLAAGLDSGVVDVAAYMHTCAALDDGSARCFGPNFDGAFGDGRRDQRPLPFELTGAP